MKPWKSPNRIPVAAFVKQPSRLRRLWTNSQLWIALACLLVLNAALGGPPSLLRGSTGTSQVQLGGPASETAAAAAVEAEFDTTDPSLNGGVSLVAPAMAHPCSSCAILAAVSAAETAVATTLGIDVSRVELSAQDLQYCSPVKPHSCGEDPKLGWQLKDALKQLFYWQVLQAKCLPMPDKAVKKSSQTSEAICSKKLCSDPNPIAAAGEFTVKGLSERWQVQQHIRVAGTAPAVMEIYSDLDPFFSKPTNHLAVYRRSAASKAVGTREVLLVGYSISQQYWLARDCKGTSWGNKGVVKVAFSSANFRAVFGVTWRPKSDMMEIPATATAAQATAAAAAGGTANPAVGQTPDRQLQALFMLKRDIDPVGIALTDWTSVNSGSTTDRAYCRWRGVFCNGQQQIIHINLATLVDNLSGTLPSAWVLQQLPSLTHFLVGPSKSLHGDLPSDWSELDQLEEIAVVGTRVSGAIPTSWGGGLKNLKRLRLWQNRLGWQLPANLGGLRKLQELQLTANLFNGTLPEEWSALSSLTDLRLADNDLHGSVPLSWGAGMRSLKELHLELNEQLTGCLPQQFAGVMTKSMYAATGLSGFCGKGGGKPSN